MSGSVVDWADFLFMLWPFLWAAAGILRPLLGPTLSNLLLVAGLVCAVPEPLVMSSGTSSDWMLFVWAGLVLVGALNTLVRGMEKEEDKPWYFHLAWGLGALLFAGLLYPDVRQLQKDRETIRELATAGIVEVDFGSTKCRNPKALESFAAALANSPSSALSPFHLAPTKRVTITFANHQQLRYQVTFSADKSELVIGAEGWGPGLHQALVASRNAKTAWDELPGHFGPALK